MARVAWSKGRDGAGPRETRLAARLALGAAVVAASGALGSYALSAQAGPAGPALPEGPGRELFQQTCSQCHSIGTAIGRRRSSGEWTAIIKQMIGFGAQLDDNEAKTVHDYLAANYGPAPVAPSSSQTTPRPYPSPTPAAPTPASYPRPQGENAWPAYGGGGANTNFSPLAQITPRNVAKLRQAWVFRYGVGTSEAGDQGLDARFEVTPLLIGGVMYISTPSSPLKPDLKSTVTALRPETGEVIWRFESPANIHGRGLAYWPGDEKTAPRLIFATDGGMLMAVDVTTGRLARGFGRYGQVDAYVGVASEIVGESRRSTFTLPNPVSIWKDVIITGARPGEVGPPQPRGDIRGWDARTGRLLWSFHTIPQPGEPGHEGYTGDDWRDLSGANVWSTMAVDEKNGLVFAPTGDANGSPKGPQLYSSSLVALDAATGKLRWFHQITHRDVWDWDSPTPPLLIDVVKDGRTIPAVALTGKHGLFFVFDRLTGAPINGFEERPSPSPEVWPTQPFPAAPGPLARTQMTRDEIPDLAPGMRAACQKDWDAGNTVSVPLYGLRQSTEHAVISYPSPVGGPNWGGASYNPQLGLYFVNVQNRASFRPKATGPAPDMHASPDDDPSSAPAAAGPRPQRFRGRRGPQPFTFKTAGGVTLSCGATPWGELVAVDVARQRIAWRTPLGMTEGIGAAGATVGASNIGGSLATGSGLVFIGATADRRFRAFDARTGRKLWEAELEASAHSTPVSYRGKDGKQYVAVAAAGGTALGEARVSDTLVAYRLP